MNLNIYLFISEYFEFVVNETVENCEECFPKICQKILVPSNKRVILFFLNIIDKLKNYFRMLLLGLQSA